MTRDEAIAIIKGRSGQFNNSAIDADIVTEMKHVQDTILEGGDVKPWFLITKDDTVVSVADTREIAWPSDFLHGAPSTRFDWGRTRL